MGLFKKLAGKTARDFLQKRKKLIVILTLFLGLLVGLNLVLKRYAGSVVSSLVKEFVQEKSMGFYEVDFEEIALVLNTGQFYMIDFTFDIHPDYRDNIDYENFKENYIYTAKIPRLQIDIDNFWSVLVKKELRVSGIEITSPFIKIINLNKDKKPKKISLEAGNLYEVMSEHLNELEVNDFLITDGEFDYEAYKGPDYDNFKIKGLTFEVNNFQVNKESDRRTDKFFYTDDISLQIKDQLLYLKDSIHKVTFDKFYISTSNNEFGFENFNLTRRQDAAINVNTHDHYEISIPILRLSGIDFLAAYNNNLLIIDSVQILDPMINIKKRTKSQQDSTRNSLMDVAMIYHDYLKVNHFNFENANLIFTDETKQQPKQYSIDQISAHITQIEIDAERNSKDQYSLNFDEADLIVKDYKVNLPDSTNTVKFGEFSISSDPFEIKLRDLVIQPNLNLDSPEEKSLIYASIPYLLMTDFDLVKAINSDTFLIDELYLENPEIKVISAKRKKDNNKKFNPGGLFGVYSILQRFSDYFILNRLTLVNGKFELENSSNVALSYLSLNNINLTMAGLQVDSLTDTKNDLFGNLEIELSVKNSALDLSAGQVDIQQIVYNSGTGRLQIDGLNLASGSMHSEQKIDGNISELLLAGINPNEILYENKIELDTIKFQGGNFFIDLLTEPNRGKNKENKQSAALPNITIHHLLGNDHDIDIREKGKPLFLANNFKFDISNLKLDQSLSDNPLNQFDYDSINLISIDNYDFFLRNQNHLIRSDRILWDNSTSTFSMMNISLKPLGKTNNRYDVEVPQIILSGIDLKKVLKGSYYSGKDIIIDQPKINLKLARGQQEKLTSLDLGFIPVLLRNKFLGAKANTFKIKNAEINFHQQTENDSLILTTQGLNVLVENFEVDSTTTMKPNRFLFANEVRLEGEYLSANFQSQSETFKINHYSISTKDNDIRLNGISYATNTKDQFPEKGEIQFTVDNLAILDFNFFDLTQKRILDVSEIQVDNAELYVLQPLDTSKASSLDFSDPLFIDNLMRGLPEDEKLNLMDQSKRNEIPDSTFLNNLKESLNRQFYEAEPSVTAKKEGLKLHKKKYPFDTLLLRSIEIDRIIISDSKVTIENSGENNTGLNIPEFWFLAEGIKYDPISAKDSSRIFYTDHMMAEISNFNYVLPDNLTSIKVDKLSINSKDSTVKAVNFGFIPLVSMYELGPAKGYQSSWLRIDNDSITVRNVDFLSILNERSFKAQSLEVHKIDFSIFRDKRVPFPEWQRKPLPQTNLRSMNFAFGIDTVLLHDGYISYKEHAEKADAVGEVFLTDLNATILNLTNDSIRTILKPNTSIGMTTKIYGVGKINAEFVFDLVDTENIHSYGINVEPFDLTVFNKILIPSASIQVASGISNRIIMTAKANEYYSYGEMKFYYEDLKIQFLDRETETPKGWGNALGSFFANTFIVKSNNPKNLILRKGDIFSERDKKRAIFNYWIKTIVSGVISTVGPVNHKKKLKKMQEEDLKRIQDQMAIDAKL